MTLTRNKQKQGKVTTTSGVPRAVGLCAPDPNPSQLRQDSGWGTYRTVVRHLS